MSETKLRAGAGKAEIVFPAEMFPTDNLYGIHDAPAVRVLVLDSGERVAIVSAEMVNLGEEQIDYTRNTIEKLTGTPYKNIWVHVTHAITTPHAPGGPNFGKPRMPGQPTPPPGMKLDPKAGEKRTMFVAAVNAAVDKAAAEAAASFREAKIGFGKGQCLVNSNRDVETPFGWWVNINPNEISNKTMTILRVDDLEGKTIGLLMSYGIKPCAIDQAGRRDGTAMVSADVPGVACRMVEDAFRAPCLFCMSAAGDQVPREQASLEMVDAEGNAIMEDYGFEKGLEIVERLGAEMGRDAVGIASGIACADDEVPVAITEGSALLDTCTSAGRSKGPKRDAEFKCDGRVRLEAGAISVGNIAFVAVRPEVNAQTEAELWVDSPFEHTILISMVNGGMKYMPDRMAYERCSWEALSSMLMPGSAEKWEKRAADLLVNLKTGRKEPQITAIANPHPDGQRVDTLVIEFPDEVPPLESIGVADRNIIGRKAEDGTVTLELDPDDKAATIIPGFEFRPGGPGAPGGPGGPGKPGGPGGPGGKPKGPPRGGKKRRAVAAAVTLPGYMGAIASEKAVQPIIDDFIPGWYERIYYNLYIPKDYDPAKKYPLVFFMPDAGPNGNDPVLALSQGIGATCWASPEEQAKHPCFVLAAQIPGGVMLTTDEYTVSDEFEDVIALIRKTISEYSIDETRVYTTGQSQGCMTSCELMWRHPEIFAAAMPIAGHWDYEKMTSLTDSRFLFGLSEGGLKEYPSFNAITDGLEAKGVTVRRVRLNYREGWEVNEAKVREAIGDPAEAQVVYIIFDKDTAFPDDGKQRPMIAHHNRGWELTYQLEAARDWLFAQHK